jgi:hypothetical protein
MTLLVDVAVLLIQIGLLGYLLWGGWIAVRSRFPAGGFSGSARFFVFGGATPRAARGGGTPRSAAGIRAA